MAKISISRLLTRAENQFSLGKYNDALTTYGLLLKAEATHRVAKIGVYLCDIGLDNSDEAQALFDYYQIIKGEERDAEEVMENLIATLDSSKSQLSEILTPIEDKIEYQDGIRYEDFLKFVEQRGDFNKAFEDVMFSTKVILKGKEEYVLFITELISQGQHKLAEHFLDSMTNTFGKDQDIYKLYHKLKEQ